MTSKKILEVAIVVLVGLVSGVFIAKLFSSGAILTFFDMEKVILLLFDVKIILLLAVIMLLFFLYLTRQGIALSYVLSQRITNTLVYLHVLTLFLPWGEVTDDLFISGQRLITFLFVLLFIAVFIPTSQYRKGNIPRGFWWFVSWFIFSYVFGLLSGIMGFDQVRANIPIMTQLKSSIRLADGLLVYYVIRRNRWGFREFEKLWRIFLVGCFVISIESLVVFYAGYMPYAGAYPLSGPRFASVLVRSYLFAGYIGLSMIFLSLYFGTKYRRRRYFLLSFLGCLLVFSSMTRQIMLGTIIGMFFFAFLALKYCWLLNRTGFMLKASFLIISFVVLPLVITMLLTEASNIRPNFIDKHNLLEMVSFRVTTYSRALDVFRSNFILGTGMGLDVYYMHSRDVPNRIYSAVLEYVGKRGYRGYETYGYYESFDNVSFKSTHNLLLKFIVGLGAGGLVFIAYLLGQGLKIFYHIISLAGRSRGKYPWPPVFAIMTLILSITIAVQSASKFDAYWYFAVMFAFMGVIYNEIRRNFGDFSCNVMKTYDT